MEISLPLNFTGYCKRNKNTVNLRLILITKKTFYEKSEILQVLRVSMPFKILGFPTLRHVILWSIKTIEIGLKFTLPICGINFRIQHLTCSFINHRVTIHHNIFLKSLACEFSHYIFHQPLIIHMLINNLLLSKFRHAIQVGVSEPKIISL